MIKENKRRRPLPAIIWIPLLGAIAILAVCALLALSLWERATQVEALEAQVASLQTERLSLESRLGLLQDSATAAEQRLAALEANDPAQQLAALQQAVDAANGTQQVDDLRAALASVQEQIDGFQTGLDNLAARLDGLPGSAVLLPSAARIEVAPQKQAHNLSCESSAASMAAQYHGVDLTEAVILASLPPNDNPHLGFRGNVDGPTGGIVDYGVYAGPVKAVLDARGLSALPVSGGLDGIRAAIARGNPVIAWVTYQLAAATPVVETIGGAQVTLVPNQHVVVVTGYDAGGVSANDPWTGQEAYYLNADFERAMGYFGDMALEVTLP
ncbi:MAG TPA: C39 family peptidase [Anaerolineae bacterium]|nr:C39 family peptidase [Anaerolineae bacterium]